MLLPTFMHYTNAEQQEQLPHSHPPSLLWFVFRACSPHDSALASHPQPLTSCCLAAAPAAAAAPVPAAAPIPAAVATAITTTHLRTKCMQSQQAQHHGSSRHSSG
jgi:hypothetical protein